MGPTPEVERIINVKNFFNDINNASPESPGH